MEYTTPAEFLGLFGVDPEKRGAADFCMTVYALAEAVARSLVPSAPRGPAQRSAAELLASAIRQGRRKK